jgi:hypothetical protein
VVDGGSNDGTREIVREYAREHPAVLANGADVAIGSCWLDPDLQIQKQPLHRQLFGRIFNLVTHIILGLKLKDTQCDFKAFTRRSAPAIFPLQKIERWGFDLELLCLARKFEFSVSEVPVVWADHKGSQVSPSRDGVSMFAMLRIPSHVLKGNAAPSSAVYEPQ